MFQTVADYAGRWVAQRKLKLNGVITLFRTELGKLSRPYLTLLKERDQRGGMIHGTKMMPASL